MRNTHKWQKFGWNLFWSAIFGGGVEAFLLMEMFGFNCGVFVGGVFWRISGKMGKKWQSYSVTRHNCWWYCWWKKSQTTTWDGAKTHANNGINYHINWCIISEPSTVRHTLVSLNKMGGLYYLDPSKKKTSLVIHKNSPQFENGRTFDVLKSRCWWRWRWSFFRLAGLFNSWGKSWGTRGTSDVGRVEGGQQQGFLLPDVGCVHLNRQ